MKRWILAALLLLDAVLILAPAAAAQEGAADALIPKLADGQTRKEAMDGLVGLGRNAVPALVAYVAKQTEDLPARGWATVCISRIGDSSAVGRLKKARTGSSSPLFKLWTLAAIARLDADEARDLCLREMSSAGSPEMRQVLAKFAVKTPGVRDAKGYVQLCLRGSDNNVRRQAAGILGNSKIDSPEGRAAYIAALHYDAKTKGYPWDGGALFVPGIAWTPDQSRDLTGALICWMLKAEQGSPTQVQVVRNNLVSLVARSNLGGWDWRKTGAQWAFVWANRHVARRRREAAEMLTLVLNGKDTASRDRAHATLTQLAGRDYGTTAADWEAWVKTLERDE